MSPQLSLGGLSDWSEGKSILLDSSRVLKRERYPVPENIPPKLTNRRCLSSGSAAISSGVSISQTGRINPEGSQFVMESSSTEHPWENRAKTVSKNMM